MPGTISFNGPPRAARGSIGLQASASLVAFNYKPVRRQRTDAELIG